MSSEQKPKKVCDEATLRRLAEMRLKSVQTRKMKAELKKTKKETEKEQLKQEYESVVLKKNEPIKQPIEETDEEIYKRNNVNDNDDEDDESDVEEVVKPKKNTRKNKIVPETPNYKNEYYRLKLETFQRKRDDENFMNNYSRLPPYQKVADIARSQITDSVHKEVYSRVFKDLFGC